MRKIMFFVMAAISAAIFIGCGTSADNKPAANTANAANSNANTSKPAAAAPTKEALMDIEKKVWEAWKAKDTKFFDEVLTDNTIGPDEKGRMDKAGILKLIADPSCDVRSFSFSEDQMTALGSDAALVTYKATQDVKCGGKALPGMNWAATVFVRSGDKWKAAYHNEIAAADPKAPQAKPAKAADAKPATDSKPADAATDALLAVEKKGWEAWKARDQKAFESIAAKDLSIIDSGTRYDYAGTMKLWFEAKCDVKSYSLSDAAGTSFTKDMSILTFKSSATGTCEGQPLIPARNTSVYVKDGDNWKLAFSVARPL